MERRKALNSVFIGAVLLLSALALLTLLIPLFHLAADALTALLRSWGVLPGIGAVFLKTLQLVLLVLLMVLPLALLITLWMFECVKGATLVRLQRFMSGFSRIPAVLLGLVGNWLISGSDSMHESLVTMALLLAVMFLPFMVSNMDTALRAVPEKYLTAGEALSGQRMAILRVVLLPQAMPSMARATLRLVERILCEATALLVLMGAVMPNQVLATELFRLAWLGRKDAAVLAFALAATMILIRLRTSRRWRSEGEDSNCRYNWW